MEALARWVTRSAAVALVSLVSGVAPAVPIGSFDVVGSVRFDADDIDWSPAGGGTGNATVADPTSGSFVGLSGTAAVLKDLNSAAQPTGSPFLLADFLTFAAAPTLSLDLTFIEPGLFGSASCFVAPAPGQTCTPAGSAFNFVNLPGSSIVSFVASGTASDGLGEAPFHGVFTAQFVGLSYQQVLATIGAGGSVTSSYSASFQVVPEPGTLALVGVALGLLAFRTRRSA